jgi:hypothetical protein
MDLCAGLVKECGGGVESRVQGSGFRVQEEQTSRMEIWDSVRRVWEKISHGGVRSIAPAGKLNDRDAE